MNLLDLQQSPAAFRDALLIDTDGGPRPFRECVEDWQAADFTALDNGWRRAVFGHEVEAELKNVKVYGRAWLERPRGHDKSSGLAMMAKWALFAARKPLSGIAAAGDLDQARLLRDAIGRLCYLNPGTGSILEVQNYRVVNKHTGSTLDIISSDAPTSYGLTPHFILADEVTRWQRRDMWDSLLSSAAKRANCMFVVITNAGLQDDWQWQTREAVRSDPSWYFSRLDGPVASWITADRLAEQERLLPSIAFQRNWLNVWTTGGGDALRPEDIVAAFRPDLRPMAKADPGYDFVAGVDAGVTRDASALCVLGIRRGHAGHGQIRLAHSQIWRPEKGKRVNLAEVEQALFDCHMRFDLQRVNYDPWELRYLASRLQSGGLGQMQNHKYAALPLVEVPPTGSNLQRMATAVIEAFNDRRVELYENEDLRRDLMRMRVEERSYGFRLTSPRDNTGHGDTGTAFSLATLAATEVAATPPVVAGAIGQGGTLSEQWSERLREYEYEQQQLGQPDDGQGPFRDLMKMYGRVPIDDVSDLFRVFNQ